MQVQNIFKLSRTALMALGCLLTLFAALDAAATTSTTTLTQANQARMSAEAEQLSAQGRHADAAIRFETLATQSSAGQRDHWLLKAARSAQLASNDSRAQSLLDSVSKTLSADDHALRALVGASLALHTRQYERAIALLDAVSLPMPAGYANDLLAARMEAQFAAGRTVLAVNTALDRERLLKSSSDLAANRQLLWNGLKQAAAAGRDLTVPSGASRITAGWLDLAKLINTSQRDPFGYGRALNDWRTRYPDHPGRDLFTSSSSTAASPALSSSVQRIALLLPLTGRQQAAGTAIRDGFMAAALQQGNLRTSITVFDTNEKGALDAYQRATQNGASMVIGPLLKEDVEAVASSQQVGVTTLALNTLSNTQPPALLFQFALDPADEARQVAQRARDEGHSRAIVLAPDNEWGQRVQRAFVEEMQAQGGVIVASHGYNPGSNDYVGMTRQLFATRKSVTTQVLDNALGNKRETLESRDDYDFVFMAAQLAQARQLRPAIKFAVTDNSIPIYGISDSFDPGSSNTDLDDLRFADMPWVINRDNELSGLYEQMNRTWASGLRVRSRLYAFGVDAFKLSNWLNAPQPQLASPLRGATGLLALDQAGKVHRQLDWAQVIEGKSQALPNLGGLR